MQAELESDQGTILVSSLVAACRSSGFAVQLTSDANFFDDLANEIHNILVSDPDNKS